MIKHSAQALWISWFCLQPACSATEEDAAETANEETASTEVATQGPIQGSSQGSARDAADAADAESTGDDAMSVSNAATAGSSATTTSNASAAANSTGAASSNTTPSGSGSAGSSGADTATGMNTVGAGGAASDPASTDVPTEPFSFFVASYAAMQRLSGTPDGFGGDLRYGEADGLSGADKICTEIAEASMPGAGAKDWHAFLSVTDGGDGNPIHAIDRVGDGPWYDRLGRLVAMTRADLMSSRPNGADPAIVDDLPNEDGVPNHAPDGVMQVDNHDILTGTDDQGQLFSTDWGFTCQDWTSTEGSAGTPRVGHSWPRNGGPGGGPGGGRPGGGPPGGGFPGGSGGPPAGLGDPANWMSALNEAGCAAGASLVEMGPPDPDNPTVGSGGGYGGIYCFARRP